MTRLPGWITIGTIPALILVLAAPAIWDAVWGWVR